MDPLLTAGALALLVGASLGLVGGGGGILAVPLLVYVVGLEPRAAIAASLLVVAATSLVATALNAPAGRVRWRVGGLFAAGAAAGGFLGGRLAHLVPERVLLIGLAAVMLATALAMLRGPRLAGSPRPLGRGRLAALGGAVGALSGMVGAGGGFLIVPALSLLGGLAIEEAIATSLFVITLQSFAAFAGHLGQHHLDPRLLAVMAATASVGALAGVTLGRRLSSRGLRRGFAVLVLATGLFLLGHQLVLPMAALVAGATLLAALAIVRHQATSSLTMEPE